MIIKTKKIVLPRNVLITPRLVNKIVMVHNGKKFHELVILQNMVGFKIGEFSSTRIQHVHKKKQQK
jgi:small subunit ribosomal protein S19